jgi:glucose-6-phosphate-specific signal transduction histidine kinase
VAPRLLEQAQHLFGRHAHRLRDLLGRQAMHGWGLMIMQERAAAAGGELRVDSAPGKGTRVELTIPWHRWS